MSMVIGRHFKGTPWRRMVELQPGQLLGFWTFAAGHGPAGCGSQIFLGRAGPGLRVHCTSRLLISY